MKRSSIIILIFLFALIATAASNTMVFSEVKAQDKSPSFVNQQMEDPQNDVHTHSSSLKKDNECSSDEQSSDIIGADYISDGKSLNATLWLSSPTSSQPTETWYYPNIAIEFSNSSSLTTLIYNYISSKENFILTEPGKNVSVDGHRSYRIIHEYIQNGTLIKAMAVGVPVADKAYLITFASQAEMFDDYLAEANQMIFESFKINETKIEQFPSDSLEHYSNGIISLTYPQKWTLVKNDNSMFQHVLEFMHNASVFFYPPQDFASVPGFPRVAMVISDIPAVKDVSLQMFTDEVIRIRSTLEGADFIARNTGSLKFLGEHPQEIPTEEITLMYKLVPPLVVKETFFRERIILAIHDGKSYFISYAAEDSKFADFEKVVKETIIQSIKQDDKEISKVDPTSKENLKPSYENAGYGVAFNYPSFWITDLMQTSHDKVVLFIPPPGALQQSYAMHIDVVSVYDSEDGISDYIVELVWDPFAKTWLRTVYKQSTTGDRFQILDRVGNYTGGNFAPHGLYHVNFDLDLADINYPAQYNVRLLTFDWFNDDGNICKVGDFTNSVAFPPPQINITATPSSLELGSKGKATILFEVESDTNLEPNIFLNVTNAPPGIKWTFYPGLNSSTSAASTAGYDSDTSSSSFKLPRSGKATVKLEVESMQDVSSTSSYSLDIFRSASFSSSAIIDPIVKREFENPVPLVLNDTFSLSVTLKEPVPLGESIRSFASDFVNPFGGIITVAAGGVGALISTIIRRRRNRLQQKNEG